MSIGQLKLYEIGNELAEILMSVNEDGEISDEQLAALSALEMQFSDKAQGICCIIRQAKAEAEMASLEAKRLQVLTQSRGAIAERLTEYLKSQMELTGQTKLSLPLFSVWIQRNGSPSVNYDGPVDRLPVWFQRVTIEPDKKALADAAKSGGLLPEGVTVTTGSHLRIR